MGCDGGHNNVLFQSIKSIGKVGYLPHKEDSVLNVGGLGQCEFCHALLQEIL